MLCFWARHLTLTVPLSTQEYKFVPANLMLGVALRWTSIPSKGEVKILLLSLHATETEIRSGRMDRLVPIQTLRRWQTRKHCCGHIVVHEVSLRARNWKTFVADKKCFRTKSETTFIVSRTQNCVRNKCCTRGLSGKHLCRQECARSNVSSFASTLTTDKIAVLCTSSGPRNVVRFFSYRTVTLDILSDAS